MSETRGRFLLSLAQGIEKGYSEAEKNAEKKTLQGERDYEKNLRRMALATQAAEAEMTNLQSQAKELDQKLADASNMELTPEVESYMKSIESQRSSLDEAMNRVRSTHKSNMEAMASLQVPGQIQAVDPIGSLVGKVTGGIKSAFGPKAPATPAPVTPSSPVVEAKAAELAGGPIPATPAPSAPSAPAVQAPVSPMSAVALRVAETQKKKGEARVAARNAIMDKMEAAQTPEDIQRVLRDVDTLKDFTPDQKEAIREELRSVGQQALGRAGSQSQVSAIRADIDAAMKEENPGLRQQRLAFAYDKLRNLPPDIANRPEVKRLGEQFRQERSIAETAQTRGREEVLEKYDPEAMLLELNSELRRALTNPATAAQTAEIALNNFRQKAMELQRKYPDAPVPDNFMDAARGMVNQFVEDPSVLAATDLAARQRIVDALELDVSEARAKTRMKLGGLTPTEARPRSGGGDESGPSKVKVSKTDKKEALKLMQQIDEGRRRLESGSITSEDDVIRKENERELKALLQIYGMTEEELRGSVGYEDPNAWVGQAYDSKTKQRVK